MLVGRDLGLPNLVVLVVVFVILPVIGFVIRRKWRHAADRREEIKRLLVLASEEAARAEIEATEGYFYTSNTSSSVPSPASAWVPAPDSAWVPAPDSAWVPPTPSVPLVSSLKPPYQCAVCFSPTSTRCAKCKAVRYCSGRCQIVHWRQGHKDECRPYVAVKPVENLSATSFKQGDGEEDSNDTLQDEVLHHKQDSGIPSDAHQPKSSSSSSSEEYSTFSTPSRSSTEASSGDSSDRVDVIAENSVKVKTEHQKLVSPARKSTSSSGKINQKKSSLNDEGHRPRLSTSSSRPDDEGFNKSSTTSSGFWSGINHSNKSSVSELDGFEPFTSNHAATESSKVTKNGVKGVTVTSNGLGSKKSNDEISSSNEKLLADLKSAKYTSEMLQQRDTDLPQSMLKESTKVFPSGGGEHSTIKDSKPFAPSAIPERSNHVFNNKSVTSPAPLKSTRVVSSLPKASDIIPTSSTTRLVSQVTKPVTVHDDKTRVATASARNGLKTSMLKVVDHLKPTKLTRQCSPRPENETAHRYSCKGLFSYEMFVKLYNWKQVDLRPFGLVNCGNSCYANAVLQCLTYTPPLNAYFLQGLHSKACDKRDWCFTCEFEGLISKAKNGNSPLSPIRILSQIKNIGSNLGHGREEDAHEFLRYAIDTLQSVCLKEAKTNASNSLEEETTLIGLTFGGYLRSKIKCMKCGGKSERNDRMMDLTVEIEGDIGTLEEALNKFTCTEILDGENKYKCGRCKSYEKAKKKLTILEAPNVLTIALKRFQSGKFGKLNKSIHFPEILDMAPYVSGTSDKSPVYRLYGVVVHLDVMNAAFSGHYVCYVKNVENRWFKIDDSRVKEVGVESVLTKGAYMLLYARCSPRAPRLIRSLLLRHHHDAKKHKATTPFEPWEVRHDPRQRSLEEESSSSSDSSGMFSESCSCSTESSQSGMEDHISWDWEHDYNWRNMNSSDSDTSSSSSSFPSPLYSKGGVLTNEECRKLSSSSSCREANVDRLGGRPINLSEPTLRRSSTSRGKSD